MKRRPSALFNEGSLTTLKNEIISCAQCPRLVEWRQKVALEKVKRFQSDVYWGRPVPSFGDIKAKLLIVGLAPAAHGSNRTGRMFTGDRSGDWLYRALHRAGFANQAESVRGDDGLELFDCYITAVIHCAPPGNKPFTEEINNCRPYLQREIVDLTQVRVVVALGRLAFDTAYSVYENRDRRVNPFDAENNKDYGTPRRPKFAHGAQSLLSSGVTLIATYHPSQQNTFTGRLTEEMLDAVFHRARQIINSSVRHNVEQSR